MVKNQYVSFSEVTGDGVEVGISIPGGSNDFSFHQYIQSGTHSAFNTMATRGSVNNDNTAKA
jgi:hypothetical protein